MKRTLLLLILVFVAAIVGAGNKLLTRSLPNSVRGVAAQPTPVQESKPREQSAQSNRRPVAGIDTPDEYDRTPLMLAAARGDFVDAKRLLAQGANVNAKNAKDFIGKSGSVFSYDAP